MVYIFPSLDYTGYIEHIGKITLSHNMNPYFMIKIQMPPFETKTVRYMTYNNNSKRQLFLEKYHAAQPVTLTN